MPCIFTKLESHCVYLSIHGMESDFPIWSHLNHACTFFLLQSCEHVDYWLLLFRQLNSLYSFAWLSTLGPFPLRPFITNPVTWEKVWKYSFHLGSTQPLLQLCLMSHQKNLVSRKATYNISLIFSINSSGKSFGFNGIFRMLKLLNLSFNCKHFNRPVYRNVIQ